MWLVSGATILRLENERQRRGGEKEAFFIGVDATMGQKPNLTTGQALVEFVLVLPIVMILLFGLIEIGNAINTYLTIYNASRDGARLAAERATVSEVQELVRTLTDRLPGPGPTATVTYGRDNSGQDMVTVEVTYAYRFLLFGSVAILRSIVPSPFRLRARTVMPVP